MGFVWIATQDGLNLFDGKNFTKYTKNDINKKNIAASDVRCMAVDSTNHILWVLTNIGGINAIDYYTGKVVKNIVSNHLNYDDWDISMAFYGNKLWIGCSNGLKIYDISKNKWLKMSAIPFGRNKQNELFSVRTIYADKIGNIWAFINNYGALIINGNTNTVVGKIGIKSFKHDTGNERLNFTSAIDFVPNNLLIGTTDGLKQIFYTKGRFKVTIPAITQEIRDLSGIKAMARSKEEIYISGTTQLYKFNPTLTSFKIIKESNTTDDNWLDDIQNLYVDKNDNVWIGCKQGPAFLSSLPSAFQSVNNQAYMTVGFNLVYSVAPAYNDVIIGLENGLIRYSPTEGKFTPIDNAKPFNFSFINFDGQLIVSADNEGLFILKQNRLLPIVSKYPELKPIADCRINSCVNIGDSLSILGSDNDRGIFFWHHKKKLLSIINSSTVPIKLRSNIVNRIFKDSRGRIWILSDFGIDVLSSDFSKVLYLDLKSPQNGMPLNLFFDICEIDGQYWITSYSNGIIHVDGNGKILKLLNTNNGLCNDGVYKIFRNDGKNLIITTNNGLAVLNTRDYIFNNYFESDGLHSNAFEENCGVEENGKIYAGGLNGFTIINSKLFSANKQSPHLYFGNIDIRAKSQNISVKDLFLKSITIPNDVLQTTISFTGLNYSNPNRVTYQYKIEEISNKWIDIGTQNFVNLIGLSPGTYNLQVKSANENGVWNKQPIKLTLLFLPKWYQTWWFKLLVLATVVAILYAIYLYRVKQIKIQQQIRRDIANDLHDDLGSNLNSIKIFTHLAIAQKQNTNYLGEIERLITNTAAGLRDMLWVLEGGQDNITELAERIKKFAGPLAEANEIEVICAVDPAIANVVISKIEKRNLLLIAKETINNSFKYASCKTIKIIIKQVSGNKLSLSITDDGTGFDVTSNSGGYGLNNMKYRAEQINYLFYCKSSSEKGTSITIEKR